MECVSMGYLLQVAMSVMENQLFLSAYRVANNLILVVVEKQMGNA